MRARDAGCWGAAGRRLHFLVSEYSGGGLVSRGRLAGHLVNSSFPDRSVTAAGMPRPLSASGHLGLGSGVRVGARRMPHASALEGDGVARANLAGCDNGGTPPQFQSWAKLTEDPLVPEARRWVVLDHSAPVDWVGDADDGSP